MIYTPAIMARMAPKEYQVTARITGIARDILAAGVAKFGVSQAAIIEMALREFADRHGIRPASVPPRQPSDSPDRPKE